MAQRTRTTYEELQMITLPEDVPELGVEADEEGAWHVMTYTPFDQVRPVKVKKAR